MEDIDPLLQGAGSLDGFDDNHLVHLIPTLPLSSFDALEPAFLHRLFVHLSSKFAPPPSVCPPHRNTRSNSVPDTATEKYNAEVSTHNNAFPPSSYADYPNLSSNSLSANERVPETSTSLALLTSENDCLTPDNHEIYMDNGIKMHRCKAAGTSCTKSFNRRSDLVRHIAMHMGVRKYICEFPDCNKRFIQRSALTVHLRTHTGEKPHKCTEPGCDKAFADSSALARHRRIHSPEKPFVCEKPGCDKAFNRQSALDRHAQTHENNRAASEGGGPKKRRKVTAAEPEPLMHDTTFEDLLSREGDLAVIDSSLY